METLQKKTLFWDVGNLDPQKDCNFIIGRILNFGDEIDFNWAKEFYGLEKIKQTLKESRQLDKKSLYFWCQYFNIDKSECTNKLLTNKHSAFSQR
ncbi:MAG: hypothetical protein AAB729_04680 [Patescibacteria group bacterium]